MSPDDYDALYDEATDESPFSNGDEGYGWMANWCDRCIHDASARSETENGSGCPLVLVALMGRTPIQWLDQKQIKDGKLTAPYSRQDQYHCIEFRNEDDGPSPEPTPIPTPPGQGELLPRGDFEGHRMFVPLAELSATARGGAR